MKPNTKSKRIAELEREIARLQDEMGELRPAHSEGPWRLEARGEFSTGDQVYTVYDRATRVLCSRAVSDAVQDAANFRLFALAERMYRFLADIAPWLESLNDNHVADDEINELHKILDLARDKGAAT